MGYQASVIKSLLERKNMRANQLATLAGVPDSQITRLGKGDNKLKPENFRKIVLSISDKQVEQAELIRARLLDELAEVDLEAGDLISVDIVGAPANLRERGIRYGSAISGDVRLAIETLLRHAHERELAALILDLAALYTKHTQTES